MSADVETRGAGRRRETVGFVTGRLAEPSLRRVVERLAGELGFEPRVFVLNISVAALMTTDWIARRLRIEDGIDRLVLPGFTRGDLDSLARCLETAGLETAVELGPKDLRDLPRYLGGRDGDDEGYGEFSIEIVAEINHVPRLATDEVLAIARRYRQDGADIIDLGCDPDGPFVGIAELTRELRAEGFRVSVDSLDPREIVPAVDAGAELVLSVNGSNVRELAGLDCDLVVIPDDPKSLGGLDATIERLTAHGARFRIDPVLEPIGFGFARSLGRYLTVRERYPRAPILMGIGNLTELTDADSAALNTLLLGFCEELGIGSVLTTEVIGWARTSVRECDLARRLVHWACSRGVLPKHREPRLHLLRDARVLEHGLDALEAIARGVKDRNFRLFAERDEIHVISSGGWLRGADPFELFDRMDVDDPSHAFYLGYEMAKAVTALTLGKSYVQDQALEWGFLTRPEESHLERRESREAREASDAPEAGGSDSCPEEEA